MSLRLRLALWYGALASVVILLCGLVFYAVHNRAQYDDLDRTLVISAEHLARQVQATPAADIGALVAVPGSLNVAVRLYSAAGDVIAMAPQPSSAPDVDPRAMASGSSREPYDAVVGLAPAVSDVDAGRGVFGLAAGAAGERWRVYVLPVEGRDWFLVATTPLDRIDTSVEQFRWLLPLVTLLGTAGTVAGGWMIAGQALRPVAALTATAGEITRSRGLGRRVPVGARRDELGRLATTFNEMLDSLAEASAARERFAADASHELRAPLTAIQANLELLERRPDLPPAERREAVAEASREAQRLARLVADLLTLARADAGVPLRRQRVELDRVVLDAFAEARHLTGGQQMEIGRLEPVIVEGDPDRLKQLVLGLLDNALKYTPAGGHVTLGLHRAGLVAEVTVRDTGVGISPADLPRVFERFYRADPARTRDPGGTGLGLSIVRWIAEQYGGEVTLASEPGRGTTATVRFPVAG